MTNNTSNPAEREFKYSESLAQWSTRFKHPSGFDCQLTIEDETGQEVLKKGEAAITFLLETKCLPLPHGNQGSGHPEGESSVKAGPTTKEEFQSILPMCSLHNVPMKRWSKNGRSWYSHRWEGGWCKGGLSILRMTKQNQES